MKKEKSLLRGKSGDLCTYVYVGTVLAGFNESFKTESSIHYSRIFVKSELFTK